MSFRTLIAILSISLFCSDFAFSTHLVGGEITYECLGNENYKITLKIYRDCGPGNSNGTGFDQVAPIGIFDQTGQLLFLEEFTYSGASRVPVTINNPCLAAPPSVCVEVAVYSKVVHLPDLPGGYDIVYQRCCRNPTIVNIMTPGDFGTTYWAHVPGPDLVTCNSSPVFEDFPPIAICANEMMEFNHAAYDSDGDSLVYSLCTPYHGASTFDPAPITPNPPPFQNIAWFGGYTAEDPIDADPAVNLDPQSGVLSLFPTQTGQYVVGVCVKEYRNGELLGETRRDFQFNVTNCVINVVSAIAEQTQFCDGLTVEFNNQSINGQYYFWDFGDPFTSSDTSTGISPSYTYTDTGRHTITLIANPGWPCADTSYMDYYVYPLLAPDFEVPAIQCLNANATDFFAGGQFGSEAVFSWDFGSLANPQQSNERNIQGVSFSEEGDHWVTLTIEENNCTRSHTEKISFHPNPIPFFDVETKAGCKPLLVSFEDSSFSWTNLQYYWEFGDGNSSTEQFPNHLYQQEGMYDVSLTISATSGCLDTVQLTKENLIDVFPLPEAGFELDPPKADVFEADINFIDKSQGSVSCFWELGDGRYNDACSFEEVYDHTGFFEVIQEVTNVHGCRDTTSEMLVITGHLFYAPTAFTANGDGLNDVFLPQVTGAWGYQLRIFDRWGKVVFQSKNPTEGWNGTLINSGNKAPVGIYNYNVFIEDVEGLLYKYAGNIALFR